MSDTTAFSNPISTISPTLLDNIPSTNGKYNIQHVWVIDPVTLKPIRVEQIVTLG